MEHGDKQEEATMKTPHAILIGLSLIAAAIFFKDTMTPPAHARWTPETTSPALSCPTNFWCYVLNSSGISRVKVKEFEDEFEMTSTGSGKIPGKMFVDIPNGVEGVIPGTY